MARVDDDNLTKCPCCANTTETMGHFLKCDKNEKYLTSMVDFTTAMHTKNQKLKRHPFQSFFQDCVEQWILNGPEVPSMTELCTPGLRYSDQPKELQEAIAKATEDQNQIGWDNALVGMLANSWTEVARHGNQPTWEADRRIQSAIKGLYRRTASLWKGRNNQLHGSKELEDSSIYTAESATIRYYHSRPHLLSLNDRHYCERPLLSILRGSPATRRRWLRRVRLARANYIKDGKLQTQITGFFPHRQDDRPRDQHDADMNRTTTNSNQGAENNTERRNPPNVHKPRPRHSRRQITAQSLITSFYPSGRPPDSNLTPDNDTHTQIPRV